MSNRDDFTESTKKIIAERAGYLCSFLGCGQLTLGPSKESDISISRSGMACHINSAAPGKGARRHNPDMTSEERSHANNGIWMCYTHGKIIDTDESRFTTEILKHWKLIGEEVAQIMTERKCNYNEALSIFKSSNLITDKYSLQGLGNETELIGNTLKDCCIEVSWGLSSENITRDYLIELTRNAFIHGQATEVEVQIEKDKIVLKDNGNEFTPKQLLQIEKDSGGKISFKTIQENKLNLVSTYKRESGQNINSIAKIRIEEDIQSLTPCTIKLTYEYFRSGNLNFEVYEECNEIFVILPNYITPSDFGYINYLKEKLSSLDKPITIIYTDISEHIVKWIRSENPQWKMIKL